MIKCLAVDDEPLALDLLVDNIRQIPFLQLAGRCKNAFEAMESLQQEEIDLVFLDIQMPGITGMQFLQSLKFKPMIIFITAYRKYALDGFNLDVLDYLVKPVSFERFLKAANKALEFSELKKNHLTAKKTEESSDYIFVNSEYTLLKVVFSEITYIEGLKDYIKIHVATSTKPIITRLSMKGIEEKLPSSKFIRVHKSFIVSLDKIMAIRKSRIRLANGEVPVSENYREALFKFIGDKNL